MAKNEKPLESRLVFGSVDELSKEIKLSRTLTYAGLRDGTIPSIRCGKRFIIPRTAIAKWLEDAGRRTA